ncbi:phBC6A51 family helix-turn-helix protein [Cohnella sp. GCM10020058]|uniref:phBC6A51 family helix-turn-helix protein n=1 Tax=Cohnella sp. GCM10020058 TaxID=3317330 RepID=UPI00363EC1B1
MPRPYRRTKRRSLRKRPSRRLPLQPEHRRAIKQLAGLHVNYGDVAAELGVSRMTLYRWRHRPDFARELRKETAKVMRKRERELKDKFALTTLEDHVWFFNASGFV